MEKTWQEKQQGWVADILNFIYIYSIAEWKFMVNFWLKMIVDEIRVCVYLLLLFNRSFSKHMDNINRNKQGEGKKKKKRPISLSSSVLFVFQVDGESKPCKCNACKHSHTFYYSKKHVSPETIFLKWQVWQGEGSTENIQIDRQQSKQNTTTNPTRVRPLGTIKLIAEL